MARSPLAFTTSYGSESGSLFCLFCCCDSQSLPYPVARCLLWWAALIPTRVFEAVSRLTHSLYGATNFKVIPCVIEGLDLRLRVRELLLGGLVLLLAVILLLLLLVVVLLLLLLSSLLSLLVVVVVVVVVVLSHSRWNILISQSTTRQTLNIRHRNSRTAQRQATPTDAMRVSWSYIHVIPSLINNPPPQTTS